MKVYVLTLSEEGYEGEPITKILGVATSKSDRDKMLKYHRNKYDEPSVTEVEVNIPINIESRLDIE